MLTFGSMPRLLLVLHSNTTKSIPRSIYYNIYYTEESQKLDKVIFTAAFVVRVQPEHGENVMNGLSGILSGFTGAEVHSGLVADFELFRRVAETWRVVAL